MKVLFPLGLFRIPNLASVPEVLSHACTPFPRPEAVALPDASPSSVHRDLSSLPDGKGLAF